MKRSRNRTTENAGIIAVETYCSNYNLVFQGEPREDYGVDCYIEVCGDEIDAGGFSTPFSFIVAVQSKSGPSYRTDLVTRPGTFNISVDQEHIDYWTISNIPVIFTFLDADGTLYWKHVQSYFQDGKGGKHIDFTDADRADGLLAMYLRALQSNTPNVSHRIRIVRAKEPVLVVNDARITLSSVGLRTSGAKSSPILKNRVTLGGSEQEPQWGVLLDTCVLGMSADGRWIGYIVASPDGGRGTGYDFWLLDRENWAQTHYPILSIEEQDDSPITADELSSRLTTIDRISAQVGLSSVVVIDPEEQYSDQESPRTSLELDFDGMMFAFATEGTLTRSYLHLDCKQFMPTRKFRILAVNNHPNYLSEEEMVENGAVGFTIVKRFQRIHNIFITPCGSFISLMIGTNEENSCWGSVDYTFVHLTIEELRRNCLDCISR